MGIQEMHLSRIPGRESGHGVKVSNRRDEDASDGDLSPDGNTGEKGIQRTQNRNHRRMGSRSPCGSEGLELDEIRLRRAVEEFLCHGRFRAHVSSDVDQLIAQIARMRCPGFSVGLDIVFLN
jgi:hypothetical protein